MPSGQAKASLLAFSLPTRPFVAQRPQQQHKKLRQHCRHRPSATSVTAQGEVPVDKRAGRSTYRPNSYSELVNDAVEAVVAAVGDGVTRMEVEFPAVSEVDGVWPVFRGAGLWCWLLAYPCAVLAACTWGLLI